MASLGHLGTCCSRGREGSEFTFKQQQSPQQTPAGAVPAHPRAAGSRVAPIPLAPAHHRAPPRPPGPHPAGFLLLALETKPQGVRRLSALLMVTWLVNDRPQCKPTSSRGPWACAAHHAPRSLKKGRATPVASAPMQTHTQRHQKSLGHAPHALQSRLSPPQRWGHLDWVTFAVWGCPPHRRTLSGTPGLYQMPVTPPPHCDSQNVSRHC